METKHKRAKNDEAAAAGLVDRLQHKRGPLQANADATGTEMDKASWQTNETEYFAAEEKLAGVKYVAALSLPHTPPPFFTPPLFFSFTYTHHFHPLYFL